MEEVKQVVIRLIDGKNGIIEEVDDSQKFSSCEESLKGIVPDGEGIDILENLMKLEND